MKPIQRTLKRLTVNPVYQSPSISSPSHISLMVSVSISALNTSVPGNFPDITLSDAYVTLTMAGLFNV